ncbi:MAG: ABC transporter [Cellvibrio sp. 79]|nr:MAG: ABC transporter [Cellvibrio sp. 79]
MQNAIEFHQVCKRYPDFYLENLSMQLPEGQVMGLVGVNGAGKSTTMRLLMGLIQPDSGSVTALGYELPHQQVRVKEQIGYASEDMRMYKNETLGWHMRFIQSIYPGWDPLYADHLLKVFDLKADQKTKGFSHGQRVKAGLLLVLARRPKLVVLDEPTTGLDPVAREEVLSELAEILRNEERSVLFSSHNTQDVEQLSDTISFLHKGKLLDSQDKEIYLDRWRRVLCTGISDASNLSLPGLVRIKRNGSLHELIFNQNPDAAVARLNELGAEISVVEPMSLEKIFVAAVKAGVHI